jgi:membrane-bound lytic murein transglycosylase D
MRFARTLGCISACMLFLSFASRAADPEAVQPQNTDPPALAQSEADAPAASLGAVRALPEPASAQGAQNTRLDLTESPADLWDRIRAGFAMPDLNSPLVLEREQWYANRPELLKLMVERSRPYLFHIVEEIERRGMPTELALLPMVESAFNPMAYSPAQAAGLWQFIPATGKTYQLDQNWWYDGRRDIVASTNAALDYLQTIYKMNGDWHLALASYNWGEFAVAHSIERNRKLGLPGDYASLKMPNETRYYVPKLQALKNIVLNPAAFGISLAPIANAPYFATVQLDRDIDLQQAAKLAETSLQEMIALNASHNRPMIPGNGSFSIAIPSDKLELFLENVANQDNRLSSWETYAAKRGESLERIAATHGATVGQLREVNGIRGSGKLREDVKLLVPADAQAQIPEGLFRAPATISAEPELQRVDYVVQSNDTWSHAARKLGVRLADLQRWNHGSRFAPGAHLVAFRPEGSGSGLRLASSSAPLPAAHHAPRIARPSPAASAPAVRVSTHPAPPAATARPVTPARGTPKPAAKTQVHALPTAAIAYAPKPPPQ